MNQDSAHSEQDAPVADTAETNQVQKDEQASNRQESSTNKSDSKPPKNSKIKLIIGVIIIAILGLIIFGLWKSYQPKPIELQGRVEAETIHVLKKFMYKKARKFPKVSPLFVWLARK
jgi:HlyD family secretion protein